MKLTVPFEIKSITGRSITGHGSTFGNVDLGGDVMMQGAFSESVKAADAGKMPAMLWQHDSAQIPGAWTSLSEDDSGLVMGGEIAQTSLGKDVLILAKMRAFSGLSIGGTIPDGGFDFDKKGVRRIHEFDLWEVSLVTFPMNPHATIAAVKSLYASPRTLEQHLKSVGCSNRLAREVVHDLMGETDATFDEPDQCDVDDEVKNAVQETVNQIIAATMRSVRSRIK